LLGLEVLCCTILWTTTQAMYVSNQISFLIWMMRWWEKVEQHLIESASSHSLVCLLLPV